MPSTNTGHDTDEQINNRIAMWRDLIVHHADDPDPLRPSVDELLDSLVADVSLLRWDEGWNAGASWPQEDRNPYRG